MPKGYRFAREDDDILDELPQDGDWYHFFGYVFRDPDDLWRMRCVEFDGSGWMRNVVWLDDDWDATDRVVLIRDEE